MTVLEYIKKNNKNLNNVEICIKISYLSSDEEKRDTLLEVLKFRNISLEYIYGIFNRMSDDEIIIQLAQEIGIDRVTTITFLSNERQKEEIDAALAEGWIKSSDIKDIILSPKNRVAHKDELLNIYISFLQVDDVIEIISNLIVEGMYEYINLLDHYMEHSQSDVIGKAIVKILDVFPERGYELLLKYIRKMPLNYLGKALSYIDDVDKQIELLDKQIEFLEPDGIAEFIGALPAKNRVQIMNRYINKLTHVEIAKIIGRITW